MERHNNVNDHRSQKGMALFILQPVFSFLITFCGYCFFLFVFSFVQLFLSLVVDLAFELPSGIDHHAFGCKNVTMFFRFSSFASVVWCLEEGEVELAKCVLEDFLAPHLTKNSFAFAAQES